MSYIPGAGMKKPLNMLEGPITPKIYKAMPEFKWSGKHWTVGSNVMRDTEHITQFYDSAILAQPRDYNKTVYGQSSHKTIVNSEFRPPLIDPIEDIYPLTRIPATTRPIEARINPGTADHDGTAGYTAKNENTHNVDRHITDLVSSVGWRPSFYCPLSMPEDNSVLPDLELTLPSVSASAGFNYPSFDAPHPDITLDFERQNPKMDSGYNIPVTFNGSTGKEDLEFDYNRPQVSASAGMNTPIYLKSFDGQETKLEFDYNRPQVSASAGMNTPTQIDGYVNREYEFETKLDPAMLTNPGSEEGYKERMYGSNEVTRGALQEGNPNYSYVVPATQPIYRERNVLTHKPHFRQPLQPLRHSVTSGGAIPRFGLDIPQIQTRNFNTKSTERPYRF